MSQAQKSSYPVLEVTDNTVSYVDQWVTRVDLFDKVVHTVAGTHAFRHYDWLRDIVPTNAAGDLRGMVVNAKWRVVFRYSTQASKHLENMGLLAGFAAGILEQWPELERVAKSNDWAAIKGARITAMAGTAAERALLGIIPAGTHLIYKALEGWCMIAGLVPSETRFVANQFIDIFKRADTSVQSTYRTWTDTRNQANVVWLVIDTVLAPRSGK